MLRDPIAKEKLGYTNSKSIVWMDGREKLVQEDWDRRKLELFELCGKRCQYDARIYELTGTAMMMAFHDGKDWRCRVTFATVDEMDPHHIRKRSKSRDDRLKNLLALCRYHHRLVDPRKPRFGEHRATTAQT